MPSKYNVTWSGLDRGHEAQWVGAIWLPAFLTLSRHDGASYQDPASALYQDLVQQLPTVSWRTSDPAAPGGFRLFFRDGQEPWSSTGVVSFNQTSGTISITALGKELAAGRVSAAEVFIRAMEGHSEGGERPFAIIAAAMLDPAAPPFLTIQQLMGGVMQNFRQQAWSRLFHLMNMGSE